LDGRLGGAFNARPDLRDSEAVGSVGGDADGLDEELVFAANVERRVLLHGLEKNLDFDMAGGFDAARVGSYAVPGRACMRVGRAGKGVKVDVLFGSGGLDLEGDRSACRVGEAQDLGDFVGEGACSQWICQPGGRKLAIWPVGWRDQADVRLKPSSDGDSSTDIV
jgi:hypothetical protein